MTIKNLMTFLWRIALLYGLWTAIYYPIVRESQDMNNYWRRCLLSGSYYHLWYYPAMFVAAILTFAAWKALTGPGSAQKGEVRRGDRNGGWPVIAVALACYFIGCMGESYYGLFAENARVTELAEAYFALFWSTRSGLFFGFFFFALGVFIQKNRWQMKRSRAAVMFTISLCLMVVEVMMLRKLGVAKDYNLYFALIPATLFLFLWLTGKPSKLPDAAVGNGRLTPGMCTFLRKSSVLIYGIHLWFKYYGVKYAPVIGFTAFVDNSLVQYVVICALSFLFAVVIIALQRVPFLRFLKYLY